MNFLPIEKRAQILQLLVEGRSMRTVTRIAGVSINTVMKLLIDAGKTCATYQNAAICNIKAKRVQHGEIWCFRQARQKDVAPEHEGMLGYGDICVQVALDADSKLVISWLFGVRTKDHAETFISNPASRLAAVSSSQVERQNLTIRTHNRRFTRFTNTLSKKIENLEHSVALHFMHYNFAHARKTLRVTPAIEAGIADHVWSIEEIAALIPEPAARKRGSYRKRACVTETSN